MEFVVPVVVLAAMYVVRGMDDEDGSTHSKNQEREREGERERDSAGIGSD